MEKKMNIINFLKKIILNFLVPFIEGDKRKKNEEK